MAIQVERAKQVRARLGISETTLYTKIQAGLIPPGVPLGGRLVGWPTHEIDEILGARIRGADDNEVRGIVKRLVIERRAVRSA